MCVEARNDTAIPDTGIQIILLHVLYVGSLNIEYVNFNTKL